MSRFRFVHAADLHLDTPFHGIGRVAPAIAERLRDASLDAWDGLVRLTIEREAAFLLLSGDIYDGAERGVRAQLRFKRGLELLAERGIQVFIVHGNHDPLDGWSAIRTWPPGVTVFGSTDVQQVQVTRGGAVLANIYGISYPQRDVVENLSLRFKRTTDPGLHIGLLHCNVGGNPDHAPYAPCSVDDLRRAEMDYWALGHVHRLQMLCDAQPLIAYPGCLQGRSTHAGEQGAKGALVLEADELGIQGIDLAAVDRVRFLAFDLEITGLEDLVEVQHALLRRAAELRQANGGRGLLLRATLTGRSVVHHDLLRPGAVEALLRELRREAEAEEPFLWWDAVRDRSGQIPDLDAIRRRGDFSSELLRLSGVLQGDGARREQWCFQEFEPLRRAGVQRWVNLLDPADQPQLVADAERFALDMLEEDQ
jgi:DNA repair exonuclease SbcCD nuclease subunit